MFIVAWNARGIARPSFKANAKSIVEHHNPALLLVTEIRASDWNTETVVKSLPFDDWDFSAPVRLSGGMLLLWDSTRVKFSAIRKAPHSIHGVVQRSFARGTK